jgi:hypothetical protein
MQYIVEIVWHDNFLVCLDDRSLLIVDFGNAKTVRKTMIVVLVLLGGFWSLYF